LITGKKKHQKPRFKSAEDNRVVAEGDAVVTGLIKISVKKQKTWRRIMVYFSVFDL